MSTSSHGLTCFGIGWGSFILSILMLRHGVMATPDSWAYWEGSVNIIENHRYSFMSGNRIWGWPPLFSLFLASFQLALSQTGKTLAIAMSTSSAFSASAWSLYVLKLFSGIPHPGKSIARVASLGFVLFFVPLCSMALMSNGLLLFFVGLLFCMLVDLEPSPRFWFCYRGPLSFGACLSACMLTHNSSIVFVFASLIGIWFVAGGTWLQRILGTAIILAISMIPWLAVRYWLRQEGSHTISKSVYTIPQYVEQIFCGTGVFFSSFSSMLLQALVGFVIFANLLFFIMCPPLSIGSKFRLCSILTLVILAGLFAIFNFVSIGSQLNGRFIYFFPLAIAPCLLFWHRRQILLLMLLIVMMVGVSGYRVSKDIWRGAVPQLDRAIDAQPNTVIFSEYYLTSKSDHPVPPDSVRIKAPVFPWEKLTDLHELISEPPVQLMPSENPFPSQGTGG